MDVKILGVFLVSFLLLTSISLADELKFGKEKSIGNLAIKGIGKPSFVQAFGKESTSVEFSLDLSDSELQKIEKWDYLKIGGLRTATAPGEPQLPMKTYKIKIPRSAKVSEVKIESGSYVEVLNKLDIVPTPEALEWGKKELPEYKPNEEIYSLDSYFTGKALSYETGKDNKNKYVYVRLYPLQYNPSQKKAVLITHATIKVYYKEGERDFFPSSQGSYQPYQDGSIESVIITPPEFYQQALELGEFHNNSLGINTTVVNTTWIYSNYSEASDPPIEGCWDGCPTLKSNGYNYTLAKKIIGYLDSANSDLKYVTLLGNTLYIPPSYYVDDSIATDFFYASPDYGTNVDWTPNYMVGRMPADDLTEAEHLVSKTIYWYNNRSVDWFNNTVVAGGRAFGTSYFIGELLTTKAINKGYFRGLNLTKQFKTQGNFHKEDMEKALGGNTGFIYHIGHGGGNGMELQRGPADRIYVEDVLNYSENSNVSVLVSIACANGQYDIDIYGGVYGDYNKSFAEGVLLSDAGAVAYIGGSRTNYGCIGGELDKGRLNASVECYMQGMLNYVFKAYSEDGTTLGNITTEAMKTYIESHDPSSTYLDKLTFFEFTLLGDSALQIPAKPEAEGYQKPELTTVSPTELVDGSNFISHTQGEIPKYNLDENESVEINLTTDSPEIKAKLINTNKWSEEVVDRENLTTTYNQSVYSFIPPSNALYLVRTEASDGKEGWLYTYTQVIPDNATLYLSGTSTIREGDWAWIYGEVEPSLVMNFSAQLTFPNNTAIDLGSTTSDSRGKFWYYFDTDDYPSGEYRFSVQGQLEDLWLNGSLKFKVLDYDNLKIFLLSSKEFNETECNQYNFTGCKVWRINTSDLIDGSNCGENCGIVNISESGVVHNTTINTSNGERWIAVVDPDEAGKYDMVFIDDDPIFMQSSSQEVDIPEKSFLTEGSTVGSVSTINGEKIDIRLKHIPENGKSLVWLTSPASDEIPYSIGNWVNFIVLATDDENPKGGIDISPKYFYHGQYYTNLANSTTDSFGLSDNYSFPVYSPGFYRIGVNEYSYKYIEVEPSFDVKYSIKDEDTGEEESVFTPGDTAKFGISAVDRETGNLIPLSEVYVQLTEPLGESGGGGGALGGETHIIELEDTNGDYVYEGVYELGDVPGTWSTRFVVESTEGIQDSVRTSFEVKTFKVFTQPMSIKHGYPEWIGGFVPNETGYIAVFAVKLGTTGEYYKIPEFYPIDNPNTTEDECKNFEEEEYKGTPWAINWGNLEIRWVRDKDGNELNLTQWSITNLENSDLYQYLGETEEELPDTFLHQCVIEFTAPQKRTSYFGDLKAKRADTNEWEPGRFKFDVEVLRAWAYPWDPDEGRKWAFSPGSRATLRIEAKDLYNQERIDPSNIMDAKITEIRGRSGLVEIINQTFETEYALLKFTTPNQTGHYSVRFTLTATINESGTLKNETGSGNGWFSVRLYDVWSYTDKWWYGTKESVPINVEVRDLSGNPVSSVKIEVDRVKNWKTKEDYTNRTVWQSNTTDSNGEAIVTLTPNGTWSKGDYGVKIKATDSQGRSEHGWAWFRVQNYRVEVEKLVEGEYEWEILKGKDITFILLVWNASQGWNEPSLNSSYYSINLNESVLNYHGSEWSEKYEPEKIGFSDLNSSLWTTEYKGVKVWAANISTNSSLIQAGEYEASIKLNIGEEEEVGEEWFRVISFKPSIELLQRVYGPGDKAKINISVPGENFNVTLKELSGCYEYECFKISTNATRLGCSNSCVYNFTLPENAQEGYYPGTLEISVGGDKGYRWFWFDVKSLLVTSPKGDIHTLYRTLDNNTWVHGYVTDSSPCTDINQGLDYNLTLPPEIMNNSCTLLNSTLVHEDEELGIERNNYLILIDTSRDKIYIDTDKDFTNGNITYNSTVNDSFTDKSNIQWAIKDIGYSYLELEASNALENGVKVNLSLSTSGSFQFGYFNESRFGGYREPVDLDGDGNFENIYLLAVDTQESTNYDKLLVGYSTNFTEDSPISPGNSVDLGKNVSLTDLFKNTYGNLRAYLNIPESGEDYPYFRDRKVTTNITFPVIVTYPNGTPIENANVSFHKIIIDTSLGTKENHSSVQKQTDSDGMALFSYNLTQSGRYMFVMKGEVDNKTAIMDRWESPHVEAKSFDADTDLYSRRTSFDSWEVQNSTKLETEWFQREGSKVVLVYLTGEGGISPPDGVEDYSSGYDWIDENKLWFLVDTNTSQIYVDNDKIFNETGSDFGWQNISVGENFWANWTEGETKYNITFNLLEWDSELDELTYGFELGEYQGKEVVIQNGSTDSIEMDGKDYEISVENIYSETLATIQVTDFEAKTRIRNVTKGEYYKFYPLNLYIKNITMLNSTSFANLVVSIGDLKITNFTVDNQNYNFVIWDNSTRVTGHDLESGSKYSYDTLLFGKTGNFSDYEELHPGDDLESTYLSKIDKYGHEIWLLNGTTKVTNLQETQTNYLVKKIDESYSKSCTYEWNSTPYIGENVTITASVNDSSGNVASDSVTVGVVEETSGSCGGGHWMSGEILDIQISSPGSCEVSGLVNISISAKGPNQLGGISLSFEGDGWGAAFPISGASCTSSGGDLNGDDDLDDEFYFMIYDNPWDGETGYSNMVVDDDSDFFGKWTCSGDCYQVDYQGNETGEREDRESFPEGYLSTLDKNFYFNNETRDLILLERKHEFGLNESITLLTEARDFDWSSIEGNFTVLELKTYWNEYNTSHDLKTTLIQDYGLMNIQPGDFKLNETANLTQWRSGRIIGKVESNDGREEFTTTWIETEEQIGGGGGGGSAGAPKEEIEI